MPLIEDVPGATPIEDLSGLLPTHITTRQQLNEWEAANILQAVKKYLGRKKELKISLEWLKEIHQIMFAETWDWAGKFRQSNYNLGIDWHDIPEQMKLLAGDIRYWQENKSDLSIFQQSVRLHHRLVKIHPFINGNGRHARLVSDIYLFNHNHKLPTWPDKALIEESDIRKQYILALQAADKGNYELLEKLTADLINK